MAPWPFVNPVVTFCNIQHTYSRSTTTKDYKILLSGATTKGHYQPSTDPHPLKSSFFWSPPKLVQISLVSSSLLFCYLLPH